MFRRIFLGCCLMGAWALAAPSLRAADLPHGRDCATAMPIHTGAEQQASFSSMNDRAVYRIVLEKRGLLDIADLGNGDVVNVGLLDSSCKAVGAVGAGLSAVTGKKTMLTVPTGLWTLDPGVYFVRFDPAGPKASGAVFRFEAVFTPHFGHDCATAEPMSLGDSINGELLYAEDREVFRVNLEEAGELHAWMSDGPNAPSVDLYTEGCSFAGALQANDESGMGIVTPPLPPGAYYLFVTPAPHATGPFRLNLEFSTAPDVDHEFSDVPL